MNIYSFRKLFIYLFVCFTGGTVFPKLTVKLYISDKSDDKTNAEKAVATTRGTGLQSPAWSSCLHACWAACGEAHSIAVVC